MPSPTIMIIAGETSGDMHGALLLRELKRLAGELRICGIGGKEIAAQGAEIIVDSSKLAVVGLFEVFSHLKDIRHAMRRLERRMEEQPPDLLILIDYPDFNLIMARKAKRLGIPVFYYISPQVWAWRSGRIKKIKKVVDRMAVILPFEKDFYAQRGMEVTFVGHPLLDTVAATSSRNAFLQSHSIATDRPVIGIMPGSRKKEIASLLPVFLEAAALIRQEIPEAVFLLPLAPSLSVDLLLQHGLRECGIEVKIIAEERYNLMAACDAVMAASGTITLELGILNIPTLVAYRVSPLSHFIGKRLINVPHISLVNLVAGRKVIPELVQQEVTPEKIARYLVSMIRDRTYRRDILNGLAEVRKLLGEGGASKRAAGVGYELILAGHKGLKEKPATAAV